MFVDIKDMFISLETIFLQFLQTPDFPSNIFPFSLKNNQVLIFWQSGVGLKCSGKSLEEYKNHQSF